MNMDIHKPISAYPTFILIFITMDLLCSTRGETVKTRSEETVLWDKHDGFAIANEGANITK